MTRTLVTRHVRLEEHAFSLARALEERREAEQRLTQAERNCRSLVEQLPLVTYVDRLDETSSSLHMSPQIEALTGYPPPEWTADHELFVKVLHPDDRARVLALHREKYAAAESRAAEYRLVAKDGRVVWVQRRGHDRPQPGRPPSPRAGIPRRRHRTPGRPPGARALERRAAPFPSPTS
ncbi:MAG TPA: PAS domain-containing protein [Gaiellaceae bacterium]|nr:PAS domain-containing protein [Gaiellaceae bacterium]